MSDQEETSQDDSLDLPPPRGGEPFSRPLDPVRVSGQFRVETGVGTLLTGARGRYMLTHVLGAGGMGAVFLATTHAREDAVGVTPAPDGLPAQVAVKVFKSPRGVRPEDLLKRELSALRALKHPNIVGLLDYGLHSPVAFAVLPYAPAGSLADRLDDGTLPADAGRRLLEDLLSALASAHRSCLLHLDVKPANVLLGEAGAFLLTDFGISQASLVAKEVQPTGLGTPMYQAPEQKRREHDSCDTRTDLWGVGITVWCALTGVDTAELRTFRERYQFDRHGLPSLDEYRDDCDSEVVRIVMEMLRNDPEDRPGSAYEVLADLHRSTARTAPPDNPAPERAGEGSSKNFLLYDSLMDPLWRSVCLSGTIDQYLMRMMDGEHLCREGEESFRAFVLLKGAVRIERDGAVLHVEKREGTFLGEVTALTGVRRTASMVAQGDEVQVLSMNPAQFEKFVTKAPGLAIRLIKDLAERLVRESNRGRG